MRLITFIETFFLADVIYKELEFAFLLNFIIVRHYSSDHNKRKHSKVPSWQKFWRARKNQKFINLLNFFRPIICFRSKMLRFSDSTRQKLINDSIKIFNNSISNFILTCFYWVFKVWTFFPGTYRKIDMKVFDSLAPHQIRWSNITSFVFRCFLFFSTWQYSKYNRVGSTWTVFLTLKT